MDKKGFGCTSAGTPAVGRMVRRVSSLLAAALLVAGSGSVWAQSNPSTCTKTGPALLLTELRDLNNDGVGETPIVGSKLDGETIYYQASLFISTATGQCAYEGGTLCIDRPGASGCVDVTPIGGIPLLCDNDAVCNPDGIPAIDSQQIPYVVNHLDFEVGGLCNQQVRAVAEYHNGTSHFGAGVFPVNADTPICNPVLFCGDSIVGNTPGETCDPPGQPGGVNGNTCRGNCTVCGDGNLDSGEQCDDGNTNNTDGCTNTCLVPICGDGILGNTPNETCDPPGTPAGVHNNPCRGDCTVCGDSVVNDGEQCDDGNTNNTDTCQNDCTSPSPCSVIITKTVAPDDGSGGGTACDGVADGPFVESVVVDETSCVVYQICVENTGGQVLDTNGVTVSDPVLGSVNVNFGTIAPGATVCKQAPGVMTAPSCTGGSPAGTSCICQEVEGVNTASITSAICEVTNENACAQPGSDCSDTANVACLGPGSCRMTGGHNFDVVDAQFNENGKVYTTGGQIGAPNESGCCELPPKGKCVAGKCTGGLNGGLACRNNDQCPNDPGRNSHCPWGDWQHNHHSGSDDSGSVTAGSFAFHSGTAAAPNAAFIKSVLCADPGWCVQARPAPFKQIFWEGTGVFRNAKNAKGNKIPLPIFGACASQPVPYSKPNGTIHYYKAHVGDFGEPAGIHQKSADGCLYDETCTNPEPNQSVEIGSCAVGDVCEVDAIDDPVKTALHPLCLAQQCSECPDLYEIEIHCTADPTSPVAYRVSHFIREGNFQLHPPVGDSCNPSCGDGVCETGVTGTAETCQTCPGDCCP